MADTKDNNKLTLVSEFLLHLTNWERIGMHPGYIFPRIKHWFFNKNEFEFEFGKHKQTREKSRKYNLKIFALCFPSSALYSFPSKLYQQASHSAHFPTISLLSLLPQDKYWHYSDFFRAPYRPSFLGCWWWHVLVAPFCLLPLNLIEE